MAFILPGKFVYLPHPHTASSATMLVFRRWQHRLNQGVEVKPHHIRLSELRKHHKDKGDLVWTVLRNPYDLWVTLWLRRGKTRGKDFRVFCMDFKQSPFIEDGKLFYHLADVTRVLRYENLQDELDKLCSDLDIPPIEPTRANVTNNKDPWPTYYTDEILDIVNRRFADEFGSLYPVIENVENLPDL